MEGVSNQDRIAEEQNTSGRALIVSHHIVDN